MKKFKIVRYEFIEFHIDSDFVQKCYVFYRLIENGTHTKLFAKSFPVEKFASTQLEQQLEWNQG